MTRRELALQLLKDAGDDGVTTARFLDEGVGSRYGARIREIREEGYEIYAHRLRDGSWRYVLAGDPSPAVPAGSTHIQAEGAHRGGGLGGEHRAPLVTSRMAVAPSSSEGRLFELPVPALEMWRVDA